MPDLKLSFDIGLSSQSMFDYFDNRACYYGLTKINKNGGKIVRRFF